MAKKVELYHLAPSAGILMQCNVIRTKNDKIIVIDGGFYSADYGYYIHSAIRAMLGLNDGDYFEIEAWFLTHCHEDHFGEMALQFERYGKQSNFKVNNFYFDFAPLEDMPYGDVGKDSKLYEYRAGLIKAMDNYAKVNGIEIKGASYYEDLNGAVINSKAIKEGQIITIDGVEFEILQTHDKSDTLVNSSSLVMKMNVYEDGLKAPEQSVMFLADSSAASGDRLFESVGAEKLKSDIVQMAHHGNWAVKQNLYDVIGAKVHLWPTPLWLWKNVDGPYDINQVRSWVGASMKADKYNFISGLYEKYPTNRESVEEWKEVLGQMKIELPYNPD